MNRPRWLVPALLTVAAALLAPLPFIVNDYYLSLGISLLNYSILATAWALFSGPTRYISLATVAFFGIGAYTVAVLYETLPLALLLVAVILVAALLAAVVGLSTLRLSGVYFVIFTFGLAELIRQLVTWFEVNVSRSLGRYIFVEYGSSVIYWQLLGLALLVFVGGWFLKRSRFGLALRMIGDDEPVARHAGVETTRVKLLTFILAAVVMALCGAVMAPRWVYLDPVIAFNPTLSFEVVIMALLGGANSLFGPLLGAVPLVLLFEAITANFPNTFSILLGVVFIAIVYFLPKGVLGLVAGLRLRRGSVSTSGFDADSAVALSGAVADSGQGAAASAPTAAVSAPSGEPGEPLLEVRGLRRTFGGLVAVRSLDLELH
ncbi:MAG TPA: hypothetical protein VFD39_13165, partial [Trueperaceae bacterium]|nr:hypothetical protein [Trueperaceae bacterium]